MTRPIRILLGALLIAAFTATAQAQTISSWVLQDIAKVPESGETLSKTSYTPKDWIKAVVPGTVLTSMVNAGIYREPLYGENNRSIPESLCRTSYWYRTVTDTPKLSKDQHLFLNFDGVSYAAEVWVNGHNAGTVKGAFARGQFDITPFLDATGKAAIAVKILPPNHPGNPAEQTVELGTGRNGGAIGADGPALVATVGWDWIPGIRDRAMGLWQGVKFSVSGAVRLEDPFVTSKLDEKRDQADLTVKVTLHNLTDQPQSGALIADVPGAELVGTNGYTLAPHEVHEVTLSSIRVNHPALWWPNTYGNPSRYSIKLTCTTQSGGPSDTATTKFGIRSIEYFRLPPANIFSTTNTPGTDLTIIVNGVPIFCRGGNWGMDEAMKRIPRSRLEAMMRLHRDANCTMIRNWVGMSTEEDFYDLCDQYGILVWDDFWLANPADGPIPEDNDLFLANAKEKILRYRNHPSIAIWCGRNEAMPPKVLDDGLAKMTKELDGTRFYQPHSASLNGVGGGGPYSYHKPADYFKFRDAFHTEVGGPSIPTLEAIKAMMPQQDLWPPLNDDWAQHDLTKGAQQGDRYPGVISTRFGPITGLADFVRKSQLANYESYRAIFEGRLAKLFNPSTGVLLWMSSPSQPSFVWQLYSYDLEPNAALFGVKKACEPIHVQMDESTGQVMLVNTTPKTLNDYKVTAVIVGLDGSVVSQKNMSVTVPPTSAANAMKLKLEGPAGHGTFFVFLQVVDSFGDAYSKNFYWCGQPDESNGYTPGDLSDLQNLAPATLTATSKVVNHKLEVELTNTSSVVALMVHLQLRDKATGERILPAYYSDNYISILPTDLSEGKTITIDAPDSKVKPENWIVEIDGWNVALKPSRTVELNKAMMDVGKSIPSVHPIQISGIVRNLAAGAAPNFESDEVFADGGFVRSSTTKIDTTTVGSTPESLYQTTRSGEVTYTIPVPRNLRKTGLVLILHFVDPQHNEVGRRTFNVSINGQQILQELDIVKIAGGQNKAFARGFSGAKANADGNLVITLSKGAAGVPIISGIQVLER